MFYKQPTLGARVHRKMLDHKPFTMLLRFTAGLSAGNGLAHGVEPSARSAARRTRGF